MEIYKFNDVIDITKTSSCAICNTYTYTLPCPIDLDFGEYMVGVGSLEYPLEKCKTVRMRNEYVVLTSRVGRTWFEIKYNKNVEVIKAIFDTNMAAYVECKQNITIEL